MSAPSAVSMTRGNRKAVRFYQVQSTVDMPRQTTLFRIMLRQIFGEVKGIA